VTGLSEFLLARIAEDESVARSAPDRDPRYADSSVAYLAWDVANEPTGEVALSKTRVLAECEAKRHIVELHGHGDAECWEMHRGVYGPGWPEGSYAVEGESWAHPASEYREGPCDTLKMLALPYADHPDYLEEWRP
jgi:hypothetical protein